MEIPCLSVCMDENFRTDKNFDLKFLPRVPEVKKDVKFEDGGHRSQKGNDLYFGIFAMWGVIS